MIFNCKLIVLAFVQTLWEKWRNYTTTKDLSSKTEWKFKFWKDFFEINCHLSVFDCCCKSWLLVPVHYYPYWYQTVHYFAACASAECSSTMLRKRKSSNKAWQTRLNITYIYGVCVVFEKRESDENGMGNEIKWEITSCLHIKMEHWLWIWQWKGGSVIYIDV